MRPDALEWLKYLYHTSSELRRLADRVEAAILPVVHVAGEREARPAGNAELDRLASGLAAASGARPTDPGIRALAVIHAAAGAANAELDRLGVPAAMPPEVTT